MNTQNTQNTQAAESGATLRTGEREALAQVRSLAAKIAARKARGLTPAASPFLDAVAGYDQLPPGGLARPAAVPAPQTASEAGAGPSRQPRQPPRAPKAVRPGGFQAKYQGSAGLDRQVEHENREREP